MKKIVLALAMAGACMPVAAQAQDGDYGYEDERPAPASVEKSGIRFEGRVFYERIGDPEDDIIYELGDAVGFGGEIGYDIAAGDNLVVGPYFTYDVSTVESCDIDLCLSSDGFWAAGVHIGLTTGDSGLVFGKLGYSQQSLTLEGSYYDPVLDQTFTFDETEKGGGYNFAFGYEHGFSENAYGRLEVGISENYDLYGFDFQRSNIGAAFGVRF
ncbi:porin family protein [Qipengyuania sp. 1NDW9]|uniref:porin family protein n=1 Tax=Qipengyuania xiapuensis TaxID=2867236 RepID=UPI001C86A92A|nr:porin family protein [Qipengyuania xiapuensis]MBX7494211.1 porin family protein [Qipengyuania xiapuensis]